MDTLEGLERRRLIKIGEYNKWNEAWQQHKRKSDAGMAVNAKKLRDKAHADLELVNQKIDKLRSSPGNPNGRITPNRES
jgi:hypothetical protein